MNLFFQIKSLQLLIFCTHDQEFVANYNMLFYVFFCNIIKFNHFLYCFIILLDLISSFSFTIFLFDPYAYVSIESNNCILLSSFELNGILLISSVKTLCLSLSNLSCIFSIDLFFLMSFL